jgi:acyl carrier protein
MENRIKNIFSAVFGIEPASVNTKSSPDSISEWDSVKHMQLVMALEEEFNITFTDDELGDLLNFSLICEVIKDKIV